MGRRQPARLPYCHCAARGARWPYPAGAIPARGKALGGGRRPWSGYVDEGEVVGTSGQRTATRSSASDETRAWRCSERAFGRVGRVVTACIGTHGVNQPARPCLVHRPWVEESHRATGLA
jgi:hypothetical protein